MEGKRKEKSGGKDKEGQKGKGKKRAPNSNFCLHYWYFLCVASKTVAKKRENNY